MLLRLPLGSCCLGLFSLALISQAGCSQSDTAAGKPTSYDASLADTAEDASSDNSAGDAASEEEAAVSEGGSDVGCVPRTCLQVGAVCGQALDGCGSTMECGECASGQTCGGAGPNQCGSNGCTPKTCTQLAASCGQISDECSNVLDCGGCTAPETCGGGGIAYQCGCTCALPNAKALCQAGVCSIGACESGFADCADDVSDGCEVDTTTDPNNCGGCGVGCAYSHAAALCTSGMCGRGKCDPGWADCNASDLDGCEVLLSSDAKNCGTCGNVCPGAPLALCQNGTCAMSDCKGTTGNCDGDLSNGCEVDLSTSVDNCGACGFACVLAHAVADCTAGQCAIASCAAGFADCDGNVTTGCETNTASSVWNCGGCGVLCKPPGNATPWCKKSFCTFNCNPGWGECNAEASDGCETPVGTDPANCGSCGAACVLSHATATCESGSCAIELCSKYYADCNGAVGDGCEVSLMSDPAHCGSCDISCASNMTCTMGACVCAVPCAGVGCCSSGQKCCMASNTCWPVGQLCPDAR